MIYRSSSAAPIWRELMVGLGLGLIAAMLTLVFALAIHPVVAIALPIVMAVGLALAVRPEVGAFFLIFFAYLDGISDKIFAVSPISGFKLITAATIFGIAMVAHKHRAQFREIMSSPIALWALGFSCAWAIAIVLADSQRVALDWGVRLGTIKLLFFLIILALRTQVQVTAGILCLALASAISAVLLIVDTMLGITLVSTSEAATTARTAEGFDRSSGGSQYNPTTAATMLLCGTIIALVHAIETPKWRVYMAGFALLGTAAVVLSFARSAALVYGLIAIALCVRYGKHRMFTPFMLLGLAAIVAALPFVPESYFERIASILNVFLGGGGDWTLGRRMTYNVIGFDLLFQYPIFGIGPGNYAEFFTLPEYRYLPGRTLFGRQLHNMYLSVAVEYGLVGFTFFAGLILTAFRMARTVARTPANEELRALAVALSYGMAAYFIVSVFVPNEYNKYTWILPSLAGALWLLNRRKLQEAAWPTS